MSTPAFANPVVSWVNGNVYGASDIDTLGNDMLHVGIPASCEAYASATTSLANSTATAVAFAAENWDTDAFHDNVTNNTRLTVPAGLGGRYLVIGGCTFALNITGVRSIRLRVNGAGTNDSFTMLPTTGLATIMSVSRELLLNAGDYVELLAYQTSGGALNALAQQGTFLYCRKVSN